MNGKEIIALCDTGACKTVLRENIPQVTWSTDTLTVTSASGHVTSQRLTDPLTILHPASSRACKVKCIMDPSCPLNLLGRDALAQLKIGVVPEDNGMRPQIFLSQTTPRQVESLVCQGQGEIHYYWTLDLPKVAPLLDIVKAVLPVTAVTMPPTELHNTLWFKDTPGPDPPYDAAVHRLGPQNLTLQHIYVTQSGNAVCSVILTPQALEVNRMPKPHVSVARSPNVRWKDLGDVLRNVERDAYHRDDSDPEGWLRGRRTHCLRLALGWVIKTTPATHMTIEDNQW